jgi:dienelactone hydrolase
MHSTTCSLARFLHRSAPLLVVVLCSCDVPTAQTSFGPGMVSSAIEPKAIQVHLQVTPDSGRLYVQWLLLKPQAATLRWRELGIPSDWSSQSVPSTTNRLVVNDVRNGATYAIELAIGDAVSRQVTSTVDEQPGCYGTGMNWYVLLCTDRDVRHALDDHPGWRGAQCEGSPAVLGDADGTWGCIWQIEGRYVMLFRSDVREQALHDAESPTLTRALARRLLWGDELSWSETPNRSPLVRRSGHAVAPDTLDISESDGLTSRVLALPFSRRRARATVIWVEGHGAEGTVLAAEEIAWLQRRGFRVYSQDMLLEGRNYRDRHPGYQNHVAMFTTMRQPGAAIRRLLEPTRRLVDEIARAHPGEPIIMMGRSGGGWTTYVYAALDERIAYAIAIAGGVPNSYRTPDPFLNMGDSEQQDPTIYSAIGHEVLAAAAGRDGAFHTWSEWDACCYRLPTLDKFRAYLQDAGAASGRAVTTWVEPGGTDHGISAAALAQLDLELTRLYPPLSGERSRGQTQP